LLFKIKGLI